MILWFASQLNFHGVNRPVGAEGDAPPTLPCARLGYSCGFHSITYSPMGTRTSIWPSASRNSDVGYRAAPGASRGGMVRRVEAQRSAGTP
jgi:hypothetical protein